MYLQQGIEELHKDQFPTVFKREEEARIHLSDVRLQLANNPSDMELCQTVRQVRDQVIYWSKVALSYMTQKSKED